jgi:hypothetical protein
VADPLVIEATDLSKNYGDVEAVRGTFQRTAEKRQ